MRERTEASRHVAGQHTWFLDFHLIFISSFSLKTIIEQFVFCLFLTIVIQKLEIYVLI